MLEHGRSFSAKDEKLVVTDYFCNFASGKDYDPTFSRCA